MDLGVLGSSAYARPGLRGVSAMITTRLGKQRQSPQRQSPYHIDCLALADGGGWFGFTWEDGRV